MNNVSVGKERNNILKTGSKNLNKENWKVYHPNGKHMFTCGEKKATWYLERNLAEIINDKEIRFTFDPNGYGFEDNELFGRSIREPICVVSGLHEGLQRHHIVPYCYRSYFPEEYKSKNHHDVVLINYEYHSRYEREATKYKDEIARIYNVKTIGEYNIEYSEKIRELGRDNAIILSALNSLFKSYNKTSQEAVITKLKFIAEHSNIPYEELLTYNYLQLYNIYRHLSKLHIAQMCKFKEENRMFYDHGYYVVKKLDTESKVEEFVKLWRIHFINTMNPQFMPTGWSIDFRYKTKI